jgi:proline iminopeptidase
MNPLQSGEFTTKLNGIDLWHRISGRGPLCLAPSPAWGASSDYLFRSLEPLDDLFTMVYLDTRATGRSESPAAHGAYAWEHLNNDVETLRRHLQQERVWLMGHSMGGVQVMQYALEHPQHVAGLILLDSYPADDQKHQGDMRPRMEARQREPWYAEAVKGWEIQPQTTGELEQILRTVLPFYFVDQQKIERNAAAFEATTYSLQAWHQSAQRSPFDLVGRLPEIKAPALIVVGAGDFICSPRQAQRLHFGIPNSKLLLIEDAGHFPWMEQPEAFYAGLRQFLPALGYR